MSAITQTITQTAVLLYTMFFPSMSYTPKAMTLDGLIERAGQEIGWTQSYTCEVPTDPDLSFLARGYRDIYEQEGYDTRRWSLHAQYNDLGAGGIGQSQFIMGIVLVVLTDDFVEPGSRLYQSCLVDFFAAHEVAHKFYPSQDARSSIAALNALAERGDTVRFWKAIRLMAVLSRFTEERQARLAGAAGHDEYEWLERLGLPEQEYEEVWRVLSDYRGVGALIHYATQATDGVLEAYRTGSGLGVPAGALSEALH